MQRIPSLHIPVLAGWDELDKLRAEKQKAFKREAGATIKLRGYSAFSEEIDYSENESALKSKNFT